MEKNKILHAGRPSLSPLSYEANPPKRILLVDDEPLILHLVSLVLTESGYEVDAAEDGAAAWQALNTASYDLLITDNDMPNVSGIELLKKLHAAGMTLPVIMVTGTWPKEELTRYPWLQPAAALLKPYSITDFLEKVKKVLHNANRTAASSQLIGVKDNKIPQAGQPALIPARGQTNPSRRILVVDDNTDTRQLSIDVLAGSGYEAEGVKDGAAGWDALQTYHYDLVITDNKMPRMTGVEMIGKLRSANMAVPVIMATSYLPTHEFARKPWLKPDAALERPFSSDDLLETVKKVLGTDDSSHWL